METSFMLVGQKHRWQPEFALGIGSEGQSHGTLNPQGLTLFG